MQPTGKIQAVQMAGRGYSGVTGIQESSFLVETNVGCHPQLVGASTNKNIDEKLLGLFGKPLATPLLSFYK